MSQDSGTGQPNRYATVDNRSSRHTTTGGRVNSFAYKEGGSSVAVLRCLVTKEMQRVGVQYSGSRFSSSVPRVSAHDGCPICVYRQGLYRDAHSPPVTDTVHATKQRCRVSERHYISRVLQSPLPRDSSLHDGKCGKHSAISLKTPGSLPSNLLIPIFPYPSTEITENVFDFRLRNHTPIPGTAVWPFSSTLGIHQDYDSDQYAGTRDEHQCLSVRGRLAHLFTISRPVPPRHCTGAQSLPHDGPPHSRQEVGTDPKTEIPFSGIPVRPGFLPGHSNSGSISQNQALISSFLLSQGGCAHMWQILLGLCVHKTNGSSGTAAHLRSPTLHLSTLGFQCFNQQLVDTCFPYGGGRFPMVEVSTQCFRSRSYPDRTRHSVVHGCIEHRLGSTLECIDGVRCMDNNRENTSHQRTRVRSHTQSHAPLAAEAYGSDSPSCVRQLHCSVVHQQAGWNTVNTAVQTDQEATRRVSGQPNSNPGTTHLREI